MNFIKKWLIDKKLSTNDDSFALSEMIQWVWRTRIRNDEEVDLYLPSKRMRDIIDQWILKN